VFVACCSAISCYINAALKNASDTNATGTSSVPWTAATFSPAILLARLLGFLAAAAALACLRCFSYRASFGILHNRNRQRALAELAADSGAEASDDSALGPGREKGQRVLYTNAEGEREPAHIVQVHREDVGVYYTILLGSTNRERQTTLAKLAADPGARASDDSPTNASSADNSTSDTNATGTSPVSWTAVTSSPAVLLVGLLGFLAATWAALARFGYNTAFGVFNGVFTARDYVRVLFVQRDAIDRRKPQWIRVRSVSVLLLHLCVALRYLGVPLVLFCTVESLFVAQPVRWVRRSSGRKQAARAPSALPVAYLCMALMHRNLLDASQLRNYIL
jgi:hypothetical protein